MKNLVRLRKAGIAEGISFLVLLFIAMPLKYFLNFPMAVKIVGWMHGILFVTFLVLAWIVRTDRKKNIQWFALACIAAFIPLGTFWFDRLLKKEEK